MNFEDAEKITQALANPKRLKIIDIISVNEICACEILAYFKITQPTLSYDMKQLLDAGLVNIRKEGKWTYYSLNETILKNYHDYLGKIFFDRDNCLCKLRNDTAC